MVREEFKNEGEQRSLGLLKRSLQEQRAFFEDVIAYMNRRGCTPSEDMARKAMKRWCKLKIAAISQKINDLNTQIWRLQESPKKKGD